MLKQYLKSKNRWFPWALLLFVSGAAAARSPQEAVSLDRQGWPKEIEVRGTKLVVYEPQLETFRGNRMTSRAAVSLLREGANEPVFGGIWLDATLSIDPERKIATPFYVKVTEIRFPNLGADEAARLRQDIGDEIPNWKLSYSVEALLAELKAIEEQKTAADGLRADVPDILFRSAPAVLLSLQGEPAWRDSARGAYKRLENSAHFVVRDAGPGACYLHVPPFWWTAAEPSGPWQPIEDVPDAVADLWNREPKPQVPGVELGQPAPQRPEVIVATRPTELVWTDGPARYAPISGTDLLYIQNTDSDVFLDIPTQDSYALFSGRWFRTPKGKAAWEFVSSDRLPADFSRIPLSSEKRHVLACVAGTAQAREAVKSAEIPQTEAVKPGPAPDLSATYDGEPEFTPVADTQVQYAVNTPYSIFQAERRYYWCYEGIWYDSDYAVGPWFVCSWVPRRIYLIPPSCPHYYVTYCHVFSATPSAVYVGYYPGYRGCYVWGGTVVYGTGWSYRPWYGSHCYTRPVTWGLGVRYSPFSCSWSIRLGCSGASVWGLSSSFNVRRPTVQAGVGGYWGGLTVRSHVVQNDVRLTSTNQISVTPRPNLYSTQPARLAPNPVRPTPHVDRDFPSVRNGAATAPPPARQEPARAPVQVPREPDAHRTPLQPREHPEAPTTPAPVRPPRVREHSDAPPTPPPADRETPQRPPRVREHSDAPPTPPSADREAPQRPPRVRELPENPRTPPPAEHESPTKPPPIRERAETPRTPPAADREIPRTPPPQREAPRIPPQFQNREAPWTPPQREAPRTPPPAPAPRQEQREAPRTPPPPPPQRREEPRDPPRSQERRRSIPPSLKPGGEAPARVERK